MPLIIMCGFPASGKTTRAKELQAYITTNHPSRQIHMVSEHALNVNKNELYNSSYMEKETRSSLKSSVQRILNKDDVVILDSSNYIKGFRYELYCVSKGCHSTQCVIHCDVTKEMAIERNRARESEVGEGPDVYKPDVLDGLVMRFEAPSVGNRWDSPLFNVDPERTLPAEDICAALFDRKPPPPNQSTQSQPLSSTNFLYELDRVTQEIVSIIIDRQKANWVPGDTIVVPNSEVHVQSRRVLPLAELQRHKRQFINYTKLHPVTDTTKLAQMFALYINDYVK